MPQEAIDYEAMSDMELARCASLREPAAVRIITTRNNQRLFRAAWSVLRNHADAEDVVQDAYLKAFLSLETFTGKSSLSTWLTRIVVNTAIDKHRQAQRRRDECVQQDIAMIDEFRERFSPSAPVAPDVVLARAEISRALQDAVAALPDAFRGVFVLRDIEGMSVRETAEVLDLKEATVKTKLFRARNMMRANLTPSFRLILSDSFVFAGANCVAMTQRVLKELNLNT